MLIYDAEYFDPEATIESGQMFRYKMLDKGDYILYSLDEKCRVYKRGKKVVLDTDNVEYFKNYFDLDTDYSVINQCLVEFPEIKDAALKGKGIRMLKQNLYECIISFIISANNNIPRIKFIIQNLTRKYGTIKNDYHCFPTLDRLSAITKEEFRELGAGFRDTYLAETSKILHSCDILDRLKTSSDSEASKLLCSLPGIGPKVADCVMLFGLGRYNRFPVDVWMFKACGNDQLNTPKKVNDYYSQRYGIYAGIAQQYIFYNARRGLRPNNPRKKLAKKY